MHTQAQPTDSYDMCPTKEVLPNFTMTYLYNQAIVKPIMRGMRSVVIVVILQFRQIQLLRKLEL